MQNFTVENGVTNISSLTLTENRQQHDVSEHSGTTATTSDETQLSGRSLNSIDTVSHHPPPIGSIEPITKAQIVAKKKAGKKVSTLEMRGIKYYYAIPKGSDIHLHVEKKGKLKEADEFVHLIPSRKRLVDKSQDTIDQQDLEELRKNGENLYNTLSGSRFSFQDKERRLLGVIAASFPMVSV